MKKIYTLFFSLSFFYLAVGQAPAIQEVENIVPNPSFEKYSSPPIGWFYKGQHFTRVVKYWSSATSASPDVFGPRVRVPSHWAAKGFGEQSPNQGKSMAGITVYGCDDGKPHCREYIQIQLREPLVVGQTYATEFFVSHLPRSLQVNNIGMYFSEKKIDKVMDATLEVDPQVFTEKIVAADGGKWIKVTGEFEATTAANYLIIGNFFSDSMTAHQGSGPNSLKYAYYYVDDVEVKKVHPIVNVPLRRDDLTLITIEPGKVFQLKNIFFNSDKSELLPRSHVELRKLLSLMKQYPTMVIEVGGHTDIDGDSDYNLDLSTKRAKSVVDYLVMEGISPSRCLYKGYGSTKPIAENATSTGKQMNRRVEFLIVSK